MRHDEGDSAGMSPKDFDPKLLKEGMKEEAEHTKNPKERRKIAMDHLAKDKKYYKKLKRCVEKSDFDFNDLFNRNGLRTTTFVPDKVDMETTMTPQEIEALDKALMSGTSMATPRLREMTSITRQGMAKKPAAPPPKPKTMTLAGAFGSLNRSTTMTEQEIAALEKALMSGTSMASPRLRSLTTITRKESSVQQKPPTPPKPQSLKLTGAFGSLNRSTTMTAEEQEALEKSGPKGHKAYTRKTKSGKMVQIGEKTGWHVGEKHDGSHVMFQHPGGEKPSAETHGKEFKGVSGAMSKEAAEHTKASCESGDMSVIPFAAKAKANDDESHMKAMRDLGVTWQHGKAIPTYPASMSEADKKEADRHYDALSEEAVDKMGKTQKSYWATPEYEGASTVEQLVKSDLI